MFVTRTHTTINSAVAFAITLSLGCANFRLPAIDPTGDRLFLPCPNTTSLECPTGICFPTPAFVDPPPPPPCLADAGLQPPAPQPAAPAATGDDCCNGPKAVMHDGKCDLKNICHLPDRGKRGRILLNHRKIIAPVGGEVVLLSGVCGNDGFLMTGEPIEWMLTPDSVGHIIEVGEDKENALHRMVSRNKVTKHSGSYAVGRTSTKAALITRGNRRRGDDVQVRKGETWLTVSSPSEGISRVTVMAPESNCWDQRKATATIYWVDANWQVPAVRNLSAGEQSQLITTVTRKEGIPATGWKVRYEILNPEVAGFDDGTPNLSPIVESVVNESGEAIALIRPRNNQAAGTAAVQVTIVRPAGLDESLPRMTLGSGQTLVTWSAAQLFVRAGAPPFVASGEPFPVAINVGNSGDRMAENVRITAALPVGVEFVSSSLVQADGTRVPTQATKVGQNVMWDVGNMPAQQQLDIEMNVQARAQFNNITIQARAASEIFAEDKVDVTVVQRNLAVTITPASPEGQVQVGQEAAFNIEVSNTGNQPITDVEIRVDGDQGLISMAQDTGQWQQTIFKKLPEPLVPGTPWRIPAVFQVRQVGQRCVRVTAEGAGRQQATDQACIVAVNPPPRVPPVSASIETGGIPARRGELRLVKFFVTNTGQSPLTNVDIVVTYDPSLVPKQFTEGAQTSLEIYKVMWRIPRLDPEQRRPVEGEFLVEGGPGAARLDMVVTSADQQVRDTAESSIEILQPTPQPQPAPRPAPVPNQPAPISPPGTGTGVQPIPGLTPPPVSRGPIGTGVGALRVQLSARNNPVVVGEEVTYDLVVINDRDVPDSDVIVELYVPAGAQLTGVQQTMFNGNVVEANLPDGKIRLVPINQMRAQDRVSYTLRITSNQPQNMTVRVEARSQLQSAPASDEARVNVLAR